MLSIIPSTVLVLTLCYIFGVLLFIVFKHPLPKNLILPIFPGYAVLGILSQWFLIGGAINFFVLLVLVFTALIAIWRYPHFYKVQGLNLKNWLVFLPIRQKLLISLFLLIVLYQSALPTKIHDMAAYYLQTLQWMQKFGAVYGLGNIYPALGLGSAWHTLLSVFQVPGFPPFYAINASLLFSLFLFILFSFLSEPNMKSDTENETEKWQSKLYKTDRDYTFTKALPLFRKVFLGIYAVLVFPIAFMYFTAPSPDLPLLVMVPLLFYFTVLDTKLIPTPLLILWACFLFAIKPPALISITLGAYLVLNSFSSFKAQTLSQLVSASSNPWIQRLKIGSIQLLIIAFCLYPVVRKNWVQTGYLLYPLGDIWPQNSEVKPPEKLANWFSPKWKIPSDWNAAYRSGIIAWGYTDKVATAEFKGALPSLKDRFVKWLSRDGYKGFMNKLLLLNAMLGLVLLMFVPFLRLQLYLSVLLILTVVEWMFLNQYRLMLPTAITLAAFNLSILTNTSYIKPWVVKVFGVYEQKITPLLLVFISLLYAVLAFVPMSIFNSDSRNKSITKLGGFTSEFLLKPYTDYAHGKLDSTQLNGVSYYYFSDKKYMWNAPLPAISKSHERFLHTHFGYNIKPLGNKIEEGFYMDKE